jgi:F-type H+-transporting ATPase subunit b
VVLTCAVGPVLAADPQHGEAKESPIFPWALDLGIWTLVVFLLLLYLLSKFAWTPMLEGLRKREETIRSAVEEAKVARAETERVRTEFQKEQAAAHEKIVKMMDEARRDAQALKEEMRAQTQQEIQAEKQRFYREMETAKDQATQALFTQAANLATLLCTKIIPHALSPEDHRRLVDDALTEMREAHEKRNHKPT